MYSDMSMRTIASSSPNRNSASVRASSVLPTPEGPRKMNEPAGRFGSLIPARERRIAFETASIADVLADHALVQLVLHADQLLGLGLGQLEDGDAGPHRDDVGDLLLADLGALAALARVPLVLELALLVGQLALAGRAGWRPSRTPGPRSRPPSRAASSRSPPRGRGRRAAAVIDLMRIREAASSIRSIALSGRKRSEM